MFIKIQKLVIEKYAIVLVFEAAPYHRDNNLMVPSHRAVGAMRYLVTGSHQ